MRPLTLAGVLLVLLATAFTACGGGDNGSPSDNPSAEPSGPTATPTDEEIAWVEDICALDAAYASGLRNRPPFVQDQPRTPLQEERARSEILWPVVIALEEDYSEGLDEITPIDDAEKLQEYMADYSASTIALLREALDNLDGIFGSAETVNDQKLAVEQNDTEWREKIDAEFHQQPRLLQLYTTLPACTENSATPTPSP